MSGWLDPTPDQMEWMRRTLAQHSDPAGAALDYIGAVLNRLARGDFDHSDLRRAIAMHRAYEEVSS